MTRCPHCFRRLTEDAYAWVCVSGRCKPTPDPEASAIHGAPVAVGPVVTAVRGTQGKGWKPPSSVSCPSCSVPAQEACPYCRYRLPADWRGADTVCVAMAGARATGKSIYVGVLVKLLGQLAERWGTTLAPANERTGVVYRSVYEKALFEQRGIMPPTEPAQSGGAYQREPLIYSLGAIGGRRRFLVLRDVAGEDMEASGADQRHLEFFGHADGVIFMFDPLRVPEIRDQLHDLVPAELVHGGDPMAVLTKVLRLVGNGSPGIAVVLSKFDAMHALSAVEGTAWTRVMSNAGAAFLRDPGVAAPRYDPEDGELVHLEVRSLLQRLGAGAIVTSLEKPHRGEALHHRFFAVSALGEPAEGQSLHLRGISPFRCLDPLRWLLARGDAPFS